MIYHLQKKFIKICILSFLLVFIFIFSTIFSFVYTQTVNESDQIADLIMENDEKFPAISENFAIPANAAFMPNSIGKETPFTTRFFIVRFNKFGDCIATNLSSIASISDAEAKEYGYKALTENKERGWVHMYRYKTVKSEYGSSIIFINNNSFRNTLKLIMTAAFFILLLGGSVFITIVILLSKRAVKPVAESYEKQKQFITNANHELKTPLTLMLTNLDIVESEIGKNEWIEDIRFEGRKMEELIKKMVYLARMDEEATELPKSPFNLSEMMQEMTDVFEPLATQKHLSLITEIPPNIFYPGNDTSIRQLISVLLENAIKYCDTSGIIHIVLTGGPHPSFYVENHYSAVASLNLESLFDRFYRADKARTSGSGFGVGLSIAKSIVEKHNGKIQAQNINNTQIRFYVKL